jgi:predicted nucleic acid-binding protein
VVDLFLLATSMVYNVEVLITGDKEFLKIKEIEVYNPFR